MPYYADMARANTYTWLSLDEWAKIMGYNRWLFNGFRQFPETIGEECHDVWYQYPEQYDSMSREELADAIKEAESVLSNFLGYNLLPEWNEDTVRPPRYYRPGYYHSLDVYGKSKSVPVKHKHLLQVGVQRKVFLGQVEVSRVDNDSDGFAETMQVTLPDVVPDLNQVRIFFPDKRGSLKWEIRPVEFLDINTCEFPAYLGVKPEMSQGIVTDVLDPYNDAVYLENVDVYQIYNDTSQAIQLIYQSAPCDSFNLSSIETGAYVMKDRVVYNPRLFSRYCQADPDLVKIFYYSGYRDDQADRPNVELADYWKRAIAYFAVSFFHKESRSCCGGNQSELVSKWADDLSKTTENRSYFMTEFLANNPFGLTTRGAYYAYTKARNKR